MGVVHHMEGSGRWIHRWSFSAAILAAMLALAACGSEPGANAIASAGSSQTNNAAGGVATYALAPGVTPNFLFPLVDGAHYTVANIEQFQRLMWRPLYLYGKNGQPVVNEPASMAEPPVFSNNNTQVSVTLKPYKWSDGQPVTSRDFLFLFNLLKANKSNWAAYLPGEIPDNVTSITTPSPSTFVLTLDKSYSPTWFEANQLSQLIPLPQHVWDKTSASGPVGDYDMTTAGAVQVYNFLLAQSKDINTYATNPIWKVVDGPWKLSQYRSDGYAAFVPNKSYSGTPKPKLKEFIEQPFTSEEAEVNELRTGGVTYGYLPQSDISQANTLKSQGYALKPWVSWSINYDPINFNNPTVGPIFKQLYIRQAMQMLINQQGYVKDILQGYGWPTNGPVPTHPANPYVSSYEKGTPYPYSPTKAAALLKQNGWTINPNGVSVCSGNCGPGVAQGAKLSFNILYASGDTVISQEVQAWKSAASKVGIQLNLSSAPGNQVLASSTQCSGPTCTWEISMAGGWLFGVNPLPLADQQLLCGAGSNFGQYCDSTNDADIRAVQQQAGSQAMTNYENYEAKQLPVFWLPQPDSQLSMIKKSLHGVVQSPILSLTPEDWSLSK